MDRWKWSFQWVLGLAEVHLKISKYVAAMAKSRALVGINNTSRNCDWWFSGGGKKWLRLFSQWWGFTPCAGCPCFYSQQLLTLQQTVPGQEPIPNRIQQTPHMHFKAFSQTDLFFVWIQIPTGTSLTNCGHKNGLMSTCSREAALFYLYRSMLM